MIYIDRRAGSVELKKGVKKSSMLVTLPYGDVAFVGYGPRGEVKVGIEFKTISDLIGSIANGRLSGHQLPGMVEDYDVSYLLIEGVWKADHRSGELLVSWDRGHSFMPWTRGGRSWTWEGVMHYIDTVETFFGVRTRFSRDRQQSILMIESLYEWWRRPWEQHKSHLVTPKRAMNDIQSVSLLPDGERAKKPSVCQCIARELPHIGTTKCRDVADYFGDSTARMVGAEVKEWTSIAGIGKVTAKDVWNELHIDKSKGGGEK